MLEDPPQITIRMHILDLYAIRHASIMMRDHNAIRHDTPRALRILFVADVRLVGPGAAADLWADKAIVERAATGAAGLAGPRRGGRRARWRAAAGG